MLESVNSRSAGHPIRVVFARVRALGGTHVLTLSAEDRDATAAIPYLVEAAHATPLGIIVGARDFPAHRVSRPRLTRRRFARLWLRMETGLDIPDPESSLRVYPVELVDRVQTRAHRRAFDAEILTRATWAGIGIRSVGVPVEAAPPTASSGGGDGVRLALTHARLVGRQLVPWPHARVVVGKGTPREVRGLRAWLREQLREHATPSGLAASAFVGIFLGVLPLVAMHIVTIVYVTARLRLNKVLALAVQNLCMPPFVPVACIQLGHYVLRGRVLTEASFETVVVEIPDRLFEWLIGSLFLAPMLAGIAGAVTYALARVAARTSGGGE